MDVDTNPRIGIFVHKAVWDKGQVNVIDHNEIIFLHDVVDHIRKLPVYQKKSLEVFFVV